MLGRFVQADTLVPRPEDPQQLNRYAYVRNNPLHYVDPTGHLTDDQIREWTVYDPEVLAESYPELYAMLRAAHPEDWLTWYDADGNFYHGFLRLYSSDGDISLVLQVMTEGGVRTLSLNNHIWNPMICPNLLGGHGFTLYRQTYAERFPRPPMGGGDVQVPPGEWVLAFKNGQNVYPADREEEEWQSIVHVAVHQLNPIGWFVGEGLGLALVIDLATGVEIPAPPPTPPLGATALYYFYEDTIFTEFRQVIVVPRNGYSYSYWIFSDDTPDVP